MSDGGEEACLAFIDAAPGLQCLLDEHGRLARLSPSWWGLCGDAERAICGQPLVELVHADDRSFVDPELGSFECRFRVASGYRWLSWRLRPLARGRYLAVVHDVTEHRSVERRLVTQGAVAKALAEADRLESALPVLLEIVGRAEGWPVGTLWWIDPTGETLRCGGFWHQDGLDAEGFEAQTRAMRLQRGEGLAGRVWAQRQPEWCEDLAADAPPGRADEPRAAIRAACAFPVGEGDEVLGVLEFAGCEPRPADRFMLDMGAHIGCELGRVLRQRRAARALELSLIESDRMAALGTMAAGVAHEINNPLTYVRLNIGRLVSLEHSRQGLDPIAPHRLDLLHEAGDGVTRVARIVQDLRTFARGDQDPDEPVDVIRVLESALRVAGHEIRHRAELSCEFAEVPPARGGEARLGQVFLNLLINAAQSIPDGQAHCNHIRVSTGLDASGRIVVEIADSGIGIPPEVTGRLFEPFFTTRPAGQGSGLGLYICRQILARIGGEIDVRSALGAGTSVRVMLPVCARAVVADEAPPPPPERPRPDRSARVLVVDDDRTLAQAVADELGALHRVTVASSGRAALDILEKDPNFDLVLCDLMMPEVSGIDVYEALALVKPQLAERFLFMTGGAFTPEAHAFVQRLQQRTLEKPFELHTLLDVVRERLGEQEQTATLPEPRQDAKERQERQGNLPRA